MLHSGRVPGDVYPEGAVGVATVTNGRFVSMDVFDNPTTLRALWLRFAKAATVEAVGGRPGNNNGAPEVTVAAVLHHMGRASFEIEPAVGLGEQWRIEGPSGVGRALVVDDSLVHLSAFPA